MVVIPNSLVLAAVDGRAVTPTLVSLSNPLRGSVWSRTNFLDESQDLQNSAVRVEIEV
jgi:hypothetical protein